MGTYVPKPVGRGRDGDTLGSDSEGERLSEVHPGPGAPFIRRTNEKGKESATRQAKGGRESVRRTEEREREDLQNSEGDEDGSSALVPLGELISWRSGGREREVACQGGDEG